MADRRLVDKDKAKRWWNEDPPTPDAESYGWCDKTFMRVRHDGDEAWTKYRCREKKGHDGPHDCPVAVYPLRDWIEWAPGCAPDTNGTRPQPIRPRARSAAAIAVFGKTG